ncbi:MAG: tyrosine-type recombinase/integrase [Paludisphaera borealis]|uniref:tyrosine-type recombinase/integrase n=1 Tax=Paludisphaera borealis TaxID=1387353 RepID=UPI00283C0690|nr:tyrosine-type recombinase/integrase [Paludisphaera borealis]MDR3620674.1 tyrosine-type recombinase/integrase [Paludisphaera borealis]
MANRFTMTWVPSGRRWRKVYKGKVYTVSCRQLGTPETKEASYRAANAWWDDQRRLADVPPEDDQLARATRISGFVKDFAKLDDNDRREAVKAMIRTDAYESLKGRAADVLSGAKPTSPDRAITAQVEIWKRLLRSACQSGQMSEGRFDAYCRRIMPFIDWLGADASIDAIDETKLEGYYGRLSEQVGVKRYSPVTAHEMLMTSKQFIRWLAERKLIPLPGNIDSRRFRFNHSAASKIETFTVDEVRAILAACDGFSERTKLYLLLMINCGQYQNDIAELRNDEVDWGAGTITRARSKTRGRGGPVVTFKLWPPTLILLKKYRAKEGPLVLTTDEGNPLVRCWIEGEGKMRRYDAIQSAWSRLAKRMGVAKIRLSMKHLRKTSASMLAQHPRFKFYANHFLAESPKGMAEKHYVVPSAAEFAKALNWLRGEILGTEGG